MTTRSKWRRLPEIFYTQPPEPTFQVKYGQKPMNKINVRIPATKGPHPTILVVHGGSWKSAYSLKQMEYFCDALTKEGIATCNLEFNRVGHANGGWPGTFRDLVIATNAISSSISTWDLDPNNIIVLGHSSGGHLAFWLAAFNKINNEAFGDLKLSLKFSAAVSLAGLLDLEEVWRKNIVRSDMAKLMKGSTEELPEIYKVLSPAELLPLSVKQVLIHGTKDRLVPYSLSESYYAKAKVASDDVELVPVTGCGHFSIIDPTSKYWEVVIRCIMSLIIK